MRPPWSLLAGLVTPKPDYVLAHSSGSARTGAKQALFQEQGSITHGICPGVCPGSGVVILGQRCLTQRFGVGVLLERCHWHCK